MYLVQEVLDILKIFTRKKGKKNKKERDKTVEAIQQTPKAVASVNPLTYEKRDVRILGIISGKGGCGKTTLAVNMAAVASAFDGSVVLMDFDIINASSTQVFTTVADLARELLTTETFVLSLLTHAIDKVSFIQIDMRDHGYTIQVHGEPDLGLSIKKVYLLPARNLAYSTKTDYYTLARLSMTEYREKLKGLVKAAESVARKTGARLVIIDFPPLKADTRNIVYGIFEALNFVTDIIAVTEAQAGTAQGLIDLIDLYPVVRNKLRAYVVNAITEFQMNLIDATINVIRERAPNKPIYVFPYDRRWNNPLLLPVSIDDPGEGAHYSLLKMMVDLGFLSKEKVKSKLRLDL